MSEDRYSQEVTRTDWLIEAGQCERAMQILVHLLAGYLDNVSIAHKVVALVHNSVDRFGGAKAAARKTLAVQPDDPDVHRFLAEVLIVQDRGPKVKPSLKMALQLAPKDDALLSLMSITLTKMGHTQEALFYAREAARPSPGLASSHMILAMAQMETDPQTAETALQEMLALGPTLDDALLLRSRMFDEHGNHHDAAKTPAAYTTQTSNHERSRLMADAFFMKFTSGVCLGSWGITILMLLLLSLARSMNLPGDLLLLSLTLAAIPTYQPTNSRTRASRHVFTNRSGQIPCSFTQTHRFLDLQSAAAVVLQLGLILGTICAIRGADAILFGVAGANLGYLVLGWIVLRIIPSIRGRNT